eukprot:Gb_13358 [translate_table: standard]
MEHGKCRWLIPVDRAQKMMKNCQISFGKRAPEIGQADDERLGRELMFGGGWEILGTVGDFRRIERQGGRTVAKGPRGRKASINQRQGATLRERREKFCQEDIEWMVSKGKEEEKTELVAEPPIEAATMEEEEEGLVAEMPIEEATWKQCVYSKREPGSDMRETPVGCYFCLLQALPAISPWIKAFLRGIILLGNMDSDPFSPPQTSSAQFTPTSNLNVSHASSTGTWSPPPSNYRSFRPSANLHNAQAAFSPVPQACKVPVLSPPYSFQIPQKRISGLADIEKFHQSEAGRNFVGFIVALNESIRGHKISDSSLESPIVHNIVEILEIMNKWVDEIPPLQQPARYGNPAFRQWQERLQQGHKLMHKLLPEELFASVIEVFPYFADSFGSAMRIDYGTGHEANFAAWLFCLARLGLIKEEDYQAVVSRVFVKYLNLMRKLQTTYWLEPAGSHGVWGLDDYHFLPFIFGSAQLIDHKYMKPKSIHNDDILSSYSNEYLYLSCVAFVKKVKKGPLAEHSPMIDDISGVPSWIKVNGGMLKMYKAEVLEKVPIMQHFLFGSLIKWKAKGNPQRQINHTHGQISEVLWHQNVALQSMLVSCCN